MTTTRPKTQDVLVTELKPAMVVWAEGERQLWTVLDVSMSQSLGLCRVTWLQPDGSVETYVYSKSMKLYVVADSIAPHAVTTPPSSSVMVASPKLANRPLMPLRPTIPES